MEWKPKTIGYKIVIVCWKKKLCYRLFGPPLLKLRLSKKLGKKRGKVGGLAG